MSILNTFIARTLPFVPRSIVGRVSRPYIAGESLDDAMAVVHALNREGTSATLDILGEFTTHLDQASRTTDLYIQALDRMQSEGVESNISVKLTALGLLVDSNACYENVRSLVEHARSIGNWVRLDMEDSSCTDRTLEIHARLKEEYGDVGCVLQAYLRRTLDDAAALAEMNANVRVCKGIYVEPRDIAFQDRTLVQRSFVETVRILLSRGSYVGIATHDEVVAWECEQVVRELGLGPDRYEFQMLLGVDERLRRILKERGHRMRVYVPYGEAWYAYSIRRLKENPSVAGHVLRATLGLGPA